jgi:hypothetical protein
VALVFASFANAQEALAPLLERGFTAHWMVCGPIPADAAGGVLGAVRSGGAPLGDRDWMSGLGGIARLRPSHQQLVALEGVPDALWQRAGATEERIDLAPFFPEAVEGVAFAGFYAVADAPQAAYIEVHSPLGARVWFNGRLMTDAPGGPLESRGVQRMIAPFVAGRNWWVAQAPGATLEALAEAAGVSARALIAQTFANRTMLRGESGFEIAVSVLPAQAVGNLYVVPRLRHAGTFSGGRGDVRQDERLTFFNPGDAASPPVDIVVKSQGLLEPFLVRVPTVPPGGVADALLPLPARGMAGTQAEVTLDIVYGDATDSLTLGYLLLPPPDPGVTYLLTGARFDAADAEARIASVEQQLALYGRESAYGFEFGTVAEWLPLVTAMPGSLADIRGGVALEKLGASGNFVRLDERVVSGELIARNIALGVAASRGVLGVGTTFYDAWDQPGIAPQTAALAAQAGLSGALTNLRQPGIPALSRLLALEDASLPLRRLQPFAPPGTVEALRNALLAQRRELQDAGYGSNLAVIENIAAPPEAFMEAGAPRLAGGQPRFVLSGNAPSAYFTAAETEARRDGLDLPALALPLMRAQPGEVASHPALKQAHAQLHERLIAAEALAVFAALEGGGYPADALEPAWRQLLRLSETGAMQPENDEARWAWWSDAQWTADRVDALLSSAAGALAALADTSAAGEGGRAIVVFNAGNAPRRGLCDIVLGTARDESLAVYDTEGAAVPSEVVESAANAGPSLTPYSSRVRFMADVPAWGMRVYFARMAESAAAAVTDAEPYVENAEWQVWCDAKTGDVARYLHKPTGRDYGAANASLALELDAKGDGELWTTSKRFETGTPTFTARRTPARQTLTISTPLAGGTLWRTITLPREGGTLECTVRAEGIGASDYLLATTLAADGHRGVLFGERFGAVAGRPGKALFDFRSDGLDRPGGDGLYPAWQWVARIPAASLRFGLDKAQPLYPAAIAAESELKDAVEALQRALWSRGVPAAHWPLAARKVDVPWTDATLLPRIEDDVNHNTGMRILAGSPAGHRALGELAARLVPDSQVRFHAALDAGGVFLVFDGEPGYAPLPTLVIAGSDAAIAGRSLEALTEAIANTGEFNLPESALLRVEGAPVADIARAPEGGLAFLFEGGHLAGLEPDGRLTLIHGAGSADDAPPEFRYAIHPLRDQVELAAAAESFNRPLVAVETTPGAGRLKSGHTWLTVSPEGWQVSSLKASGWGASIGKSAMVHPRNGVLLRGHATGAGEWAGSVGLSVPVLAAHAGGAFEEPGAALGSAGNGFDTGAMASHATRAWWVLPRVSPSSPSVPAAAPTLSYSEHWKHGEAVPRAERPIAAVRVEADWAAGTAAVAVGNLASDAVLEGTLRVEMSQGWSYGPDEVAVRLGPGEARDFSLLFTAPGSGARGQVNVMLESGGQRWMASASNGEAWLSAEVKRGEGKVRVRLTNDMTVTARGSISLAAAPGTGEVLRRWRGTSLGTGAPASLERAIDLPPGAFTEFAFDAGSGAGSAVRIAANGRFRYVPVR